MQLATISLIDFILHVFFAVPHNVVHPARQEIVIDLITGEGLGNGFKGDVTRLKYRCYKFYAQSGLSRLCGAKTRPFIDNFSKKIKLQNIICLKSSEPY